MYEPSARQELDADKSHKECMIVVNVIYIVITAAITIALTLLSHNRHNDSLSSELNRYIKQITALLLCDNPEQYKILARSNKSRIALAEAIYIVMSHTYNNDTETLRHIVEQNRLESFLLCEIRRSRGARRAHLLMLLSAIPNSGEIFTQLYDYIHSHDRDVRISALTAALAANPSVAIRTISTFEFDLSPFDTARIIALLRRGLLPIAYEPLLANGNRNLRMLGLAIVRCFGIEIAEKHLHKIISNEDDSTIVKQTIYTLASLGRPLGHTRIRERLVTMPAHKRKELCRHLTVEGYSLSSVRTLFTESESTYAESLINSYKRALTNSAANI